MLRSRRDHNLHGGEETPSFYSTSMLDMGDAQLAERTENEEPHAHKESVVTPTTVLRDQMSRLLEKVRGTQGMVSQLERRGFQLSQLRHRTAPYEVGSTIRDDSAEKNQYRFVFGAKIGPEGAGKVAMLTCDTHVAPLQLTEVTNDVSRCSRLAILKRMGVLKQEYDTIRTHSVAILGLGGIGSLVAEQMVRSGVGVVVAIDNEIVRQRSLGRMTYRPEHLGMTKAQAARIRLTRLNADADVRAVTADIMDDEQLPMIINALKLRATTDLVRKEKEREEGKDGDGDGDRDDEDEDEDGEDVRLFGETKRPCKPSIHQHSPRQLSRADTAGSRAQNQGFWDI